MAADFERSNLQTGATGRHSLHRKVNRLAIHGNAMKRSAQPQAHCLSIGI